MVAIFMRGRGRGLVTKNVLLLSKVGGLIKREDYFEIREHFNIPPLISKLKNVIYYQFPKILETRVWSHRARDIGREPWGQGA